MISNLQWFWWMMSFLSTEIWSKWSLVSFDMESLFAKFWGMGSGNSSFNGTVGFLFFSSLDSFLWGSNRQSWGAFPSQYVVEFWNSRCPRKHINTSLTRDGLNDIRLTPPPLSHLTDFSVGWTFHHVYTSRNFIWNYTRCFRINIFTAVYLS